MLSQRTKQSLLKSLAWQPRVQSQAMAGTALLLQTLVPPDMHHRLLRGINGYCAQCSGPPLTATGTTAAWAAAPTPPSVTSLMLPYKTARRVHIMRQTRTKFMGLLRCSAAIGAALTPVGSLDLHDAKQHRLSCNRHSFDSLT